MTRARAVTMDDKVPSGGCEGISGSRPGILALRFALEHTPSQPRRRTNVTLPSLKRPRRRLIDNERGDAEERRFAQRQRAARQGVTQDRGHCQRPRALARPCRRGRNSRVWNRSEGVEAITVLEDHGGKGARAIVTASRCVPRGALRGAGSAPARCPSAPFSLASLDASIHHESSLPSSRFKPASMLRFPLR